jgi:1-acylglycerone phosphate reductase
MPPMHPRQKYALVTGYRSVLPSPNLRASLTRCSCGQGGIGEALVTEYARQGLHAIATVLPSEPSDHLSGPRISCFTLDVTDDQSITDLHEKVIALTGGYLDVMVNNA